MTKKQKQRRERLLPGGVPKDVRIYDNGGESTDLYTVVFTGRYTHKTGRKFRYTTMSEHPYDPWGGVGLHCEFTGAKFRNEKGDEWYQWHVDRPRSRHLGKRIRFEDLPPDAQRLTLSDYCYLRDISGVSREADAQLEFDSALVPQRHAVR